MNRILNQLGDRFLSLLGVIEDFFVSGFYKALKTRELVWIVVLLCYFSVLVFDFFPYTVDLTEKQVAPADIMAPRTVEIVDKERTQLLRDQAAREVKPVYELDTMVESQAINDINIFFNMLERSKTKDFIELKKNLPIKITDDVAKRLFSLKQDQFSPLRKAVIYITSGVLDKGISPQNLDIVGQLLNDEASKLNTPQDIKDLSIILAKYFVKPNLFLDVAETQRRQEEARNSIPPVKQVILKGQVIIRKGDIVTKEHIKLLDALGLRQKKTNLVGMVGLFIILVLAGFAMVTFMRNVLPSIYENVMLNWLIAILLIVGLILVRGFSYISIYLIPLATIGILATTLLDYRIAILLVIFAGIIPNIANLESLRYFFPLFIGSIGGILATLNVTQRSDFTKAGATIALVQAFGVGAISLMGYTDIRSILINIGYGVGSGILSAILAIGMMPYLEHLFQIVTAIRLTELTNFTQPLLKRLMLEAPGTYHHSVLIGNLAEAAGEALGANLPLIRAGAYYHDIGKIRRPYFFIENQLAGENIHDRLPPSLSKLIILRHVDDGVALARRYKIPEQIIDFIREHHGTSLVSYFYYQAMKEDPKNTKEEDYRYKGPKPQTKETAILMLADAVEAAVRALDHPNPQKLESTVRHIIEERLNDGQLDESPLTLRDLSIIGEAFVKVLTGMFHLRIEYPEVSTQRNGKVIGYRSS
jgi:putative nucleotidyltransferase with HDIG domain